MGTYNLRRFAHADGLKAIERRHLVALLEPFSDFLESRGVTLPRHPSDADELDYEGLVTVFMTPDMDTPKGLADALFFIHEMATPEGMDILLHEAESNGMKLDGSPDPTPADVAVQVYLQDKDLIERKHAEQYLTRPRSFEYFQTDINPIPQFRKPSSKTLKALEKDLDDLFEKKKRGRGSRVFVYPKKDAIWFLVRHGEPYKREGSLEAGQSTSVFYRPEKHDVLVYEPSIGELRINAAYGSLTCTCFDQCTKIFNHINFQVRFMNKIFHRWPIIWIPSLNWSIFVLNEFHDVFLCITSIIKWNSIFSSRPSPRCLKEGKNSPSISGIFHDVPPFGDFISIM